MLDLGRSDAGDEPAGLNVAGPGSGRSVFLITAYATWCPTVSRCTPVSRAISWLEQPDLWSVRIVSTAAIVRRFAIGRLLQRANAEGYAAIGGS